MPTALLVARIALLAIASGISVEQAAVLELGVPRPMSELAARMLVTLEQGGRAWTTSNDLIDEAITHALPGLDAALEQRTETQLGDVTADALPPFGDVERCRTYLKVVLPADPDDAARIAWTARTVYARLEAAT